MQWEYITGERPLELASDCWVKMPLTCVFALYAAPHSMRWPSTEQYGDVDEHICCTFPVLL